jgi:hypothetical protein
MNSIIVMTLGTLWTAALMWFFWSCWRAPELRDDHTRSPWH